MNSGQTSDGVTSFKKVWLTHETPRASFTPKRSVGTLNVGPAGLSFESPKETWTIPITRIEHRGMGAAGTDIVNKWVRIGYTDEAGSRRDMYVNDGRLLGWAGIFGGAKKLDAAIRAVAGPR